MATKITNVTCKSSLKAESRNLFLDGISKINKNDEITKYYVKLKTTSFCPRR